MTEQVFQNQIQRLEREFKYQYSQERTALIWKEVNNLSDDWMRRVCDEFIGGHKYAPLLPEFRKEATPERERQRAVQRKQESYDAFIFMSSSFGGETVQGMMAIIRDRINGACDDKNWQDFKLGLKEMSKVRCQTCEDTGLVYKVDSYTYYFACQWCDLGKQFLNLRQSERHNLER